ncbi:MAG: hypothetical protein KGZ25_12810 [Planctomycetes bacterium]|nr:hypothetical protein [Planctomycetota bacterium]
MRKEWIIALILLIAGIAAPARATNETIQVQARGKDNPQEEAADVEGHFSKEPTGDKDEIHVTNPDVKGKAADVYDDPLNDGALLVITRREDPVKVEVEGREGIGALYWVSVVPGGGEGGGGGAAPTVLWADVKDMEEPGSLVLRDDNTGRGVSDSDNISEDEDGDPDTDLPSLHCSLAEDDRGDVSFRLNVQSGTYDWSATSGHSGTWTGPPYLTSLSDLNPGVYTVTVTKDGEPDFERKIKFAVLEVVLRPKSGRFPKCCNAGIADDDFVYDTKPARFKDQIALIYEQTCQPDEGEDGVVRKTCEARLEGVTVATCIYELIKPGFWNTTWAEEEKKLEATLPHQGYRYVSREENTTYKDMWGNEHNALIRVFRTYDYKFTGSDNRGTYPLGLTEEICLEASRQADLNISYKGIGVTITAAWSQSRTHSYSYEVPDEDEGRFWELRAYQQRLYATGWILERDGDGKFTDDDVLEGECTGWQPLTHFAKGVRWKCPE